MATITLCHFPPTFSLSSHKLLFSSSFPLRNSNIHHNYSRIYASSSFKKPRASKKVKKSNADLCNDIREFLSSNGLPEDHVPSFKELAENGRQDLANIVRRRGYKFIRQLLETSTTGNFTDSSIEGQNEKLEVLEVDVSPSEAVPEANFYDCVETDNELKLNGQSSLASELTTLSLEEKELDEVSDLEITNERDVDEPKRTVEAEDARETVNGNVTSFVDNYISTEDRTSDYTELDVEKNQKMENQAEIKRLKFLLHKKELELTQLQQLIEREKLALSALQSKAETEIIKAQKLISEKENELNAAEENLSGLKEVEIQYSGDGEIVEVAGSFNGWHQKIKMEPQLPSTITDLTGPRTSQIWKAVLWLYPGVYEIKFVIDGHWRIDPQRESITRGSLHNNLLRVER